MIAKNTVMLIGATGLVGNLTLKKLLEDDFFDEVRVISRRSTGYKHPKLQELNIDFEDLQGHLKFLKCEVLISCLGSTMKKAGNKQTFKRFDYYYPSEVAGYCRMNGTKKMVLLSAQGADEHSLFYYNQIKGKLENICKELSFKELDILRPSLILGHRNEHRTGEHIGKILAKVLGPILPKQYQAVEAEQLAATLVDCAKTSSEKEVRIITKKNFS